MRALTSAHPLQWVEDLIKQSEERQGASLDATLEAKISAKLDGYVDVVGAATTQATSEAQGVPAPQLVRILGSVRAWSRTQCDHAGAARRIRRLADVCRGIAASWAIIHS